ncbi:hypothetical protein HK104_006854, partial [Borealophlyctis nickersoniae]
MSGVDTETPLVFNADNINNYIDNNFFWTALGRELTALQQQQATKFVVDTVSASRSAQAVQVVISANTPANTSVTSGITIDQSRTLKTEAKMVQMLQRQLITYDGQRNVQTFNQFFQQLNQLFAYQSNIPDEEKILIATTHLRSTANTWLQNQQKQHAAKEDTPYHESMTWDEWYALFHKAFYPVDAVTTAREKLNKLTQTKSWKAYCDAFITLSLQVPDLSDTEQKDKDSSAQEIDTIYFASKKRNNPTPYRPRPTPAPTSGPTPMDIDSTTATKKDDKQSNGARAPLTAAECKHLIANKGCFYCRKINCGHQVRNCPDKIAADKAKQVKVNAASATPAASSDSSSTP